MYQKRKNEEISNHNNLKKNTHYNYDSHSISKNKNSASRLKSIERLKTSNKSLRKSSVAISSTRNHTAHHDKIYCY
jgi:hypothetical protein